MTTQPLPNYNASDTPTASSPEQSTAAQEVRIALHTPGCMVEDCQWAAHTKCDQCNKLICLTHSLRGTRYTFCTKCAQELNKRVAAFHRCFAGVIIGLALAVLIFAFAV